MPEHRAPREVRLTVRLPAELLAAVRRLADANERSLAGEIRLALKAHLANQGMADLTGGRRLS